MSDTQIVSKYDELAAVLVAEHITRYVGREAGLAWKKEQDLRIMLGVTAGKMGKGTEDVVMRDKAKAAKELVSRLEADWIARGRAGNLQGAESLLAELNAAHDALAECRRVERKASTLRQLQLDCEDKTNCTDVKYIAPSLARAANALEMGDWVREITSDNEFLAEAVSRYGVLVSSDTLTTLETLAADAKAAIAHADSLKQAVVDIETKIAARETALAGFEENSPEAADLRKAIKSLSKNLEAAKSEQVNAAQLAEKAVKSAQEAAAAKFGNN